MKKKHEKNTYQDNYHFAKKNMHFCIDLEWLQLFSLLHFFSVFPPISFNIFSEPYWLVKNQIKCLVFKLFFKKEIDKVSFKDCLPENLFQNLYNWLHSYFEQSDCSIKFGIVFSIITNLLHCY